MFLMPNKSPEPLKVVLSGTKLAFSLWYFKCLAEFVEFKIASLIQCRYGSSYDHWQAGSRMCRFDVLRSCGLVVAGFGFFNFRP
jgi:hypothetical protein